LVPFKDVPVGGEFRIFQGWGLLWRKVGPDTATVVDGDRTRMQMRSEHVYIDPFVALLAGME
jgi:hypothetical protein